MMRSIGDPSAPRGSKQVRRIDGNVLEIAFGRVDPAPPAMAGQGWYHEAAIAADEQARALRHNWRPALN